VMKKVGPETSPTACTWPEQPIYATKEVGPETFPTASTWPVQSIYVLKKFGPALPLQHVRGMYSLYT
jgi:hypothetical protein